MQRDLPVEPALLLHGCLERVTAHNADLFLLSHAVRKRQDRLGMILAKGFGDVDGVPVQFAGCYIAATGADAGQDQAFVKGIFQRLQAEQNYVSWTESAFAEDASQGAKATRIYSAIFLLIAAAGVAIWSKIS